MATTKVIYALDENFTLDDLLEISGGKIQPIKQYLDDTDLADGLTPTSSDVSAADLDKVTDNSLATFAYLPSGAPAYIHFDLGAEYTLALIKLWHLVSGTNRKYKDVIVQISTDDTNWTTVFNNDSDDSAGEGVGTDSEYQETDAGKSIALGTAGMQGRYIRIWSNGSNLDSISHFAQVEVYQYTYPTDNPKAITVDSWKLNDLNQTAPEFEATVTETGSDAVKFQVLVDNIAYFWDGLEWVVAEQSYDYSNTASELNTNLPTLLDTPEPVEIKWIVYFHSNDGTTYPDLTSFTFKYDLDETSTGTGKPATRKLYGFIYDNQGMPVNNKTLTITLQPSRNVKIGNAFLSPITITTSTDSDGYFEFEAIPTADLTPNTVQYLIMITELGLKHVISVPTGSTPIDLGTLM